MSTDYRRYESYDALVRAALGPSDCLPRSSRENRTSWAGASWKYAQATAPLGDMEKAKALSPQILEGANAVMQTVRLDPVYRVDGGYWIDVARYVDGEPECWGDFVEEKKAPKKGLAIVFNACANSRVSAGVFGEVGKTIAETVIGLQSMGHTVDLYVVYKNAPGCGYTLITVCALKGMLNVAQLAAICSQWFFRRIIFSLWETYDPSTRAKIGVPDNGYGRSHSVTAQEAQVISGHERNAVINIAHYEYGTGTLQADILRTLKGD